MSLHPKAFFILEALVPGSGWHEPNILFIREDDGRYRIASGDDIAWVNEKTPNFFEETLDAGYCEQCGAKQISRYR
jgi:hypothetical protein